MSWKWDDPQEPCELLRKNFTEKAGVFRRKDNTYVPTPEEEEALDFLFIEWDFAYEHEPKENV